MEGKKNSWMRPQTIEKGKHNMGKRHRVEKKTINKRKRVGCKKETTLRAEKDHLKEKRLPILKRSNRSTVKVAYPQQKETKTVRKDTKTRKDVVVVRGGIYRKRLATEMGGMLQLL